MGERTMADTQAFMNFLISQAVGDGAIVIAPHPEPFRPKERNFLDGIRSVPSSISAPPGKNPFVEVFARPGRWMFIWVPER